MTDVPGAPPTPVPPGVPSHAAATPRGPVRRWPTRLVAASTAAAWVAMACIAGGLVLGAIPVENPGVQKCGAPLAFVLAARPDVYANPNDPPSGMTPALADAANRHRCQNRVAARMVPAGGLIIAGLVAGLSGVAMLAIGRRTQRRRAGVGRP